MDKLKVTKADIVDLLVTRYHRRVGKEYIQIVQEYEYHLDKIKDLQVRQLKLAEDYIRNTFPATQEVEEAVGKLIVQSKGSSKGGLPTQFYLRTECRFEVEDAHFCLPFNVPSGTFAALESEYNTLIQQGKVLHEQKVEAGRKVNNTEAYRKKMKEKIILKVLSNTDIIEEMEANCDDLDCED